MDGVPIPWARQARWSFGAGAVGALSVAAFFSSELSAPYWGSTYAPLGFGEALVCALLLGVPVKLVAFAAQRAWVRRFTTRARAARSRPGRLGCALRFWLVDLAVSALAVVALSPILVVLFFVAVGVPVAFCALPVQLVAGWFLAPDLSPSPAAPALAPAGRARPSP